MWTKSNNSSILRVGCRAPAKRETYVYESSNDSMMMCTIHLPELFPPSFEGRGQGARSGSVKNGARPAYGAAIAGA